MKTSIRWDLIIENNLCSKKKVKNCTIYVKNFVWQKPLKKIIFVVSISISMIKME